MRLPEPRATSSTTTPRTGLLAGICPAVNVFGRAALVRLGFTLGGAVARVLDATDGGAVDVTGAGAVAVVLATVV